MHRIVIPLVIKMEGGDEVVDHPSDPGGITKYGISLKAYPALGRQGIIDLTLEQATAIYKRDYWDKCRCGELPPPVALLVFDCAVNQGYGRAVRLLQSAVGVKSDGVLGSTTLEAVNRRSHIKTIIEFSAQRAVRYGLLDTFKTFGLGWMRRMFTMFSIACALEEEGK